MVTHVKVSCSKCISVPEKIKNAFVIKNVLSSGCILNTPKAVQETHKYTFIFYKKRGHSTSAITFLKNIFGKDLFDFSGKNVLLTGPMRPEQKLSPVQPQLMILPESRNEKRHLSR